MRPKKFQITAFGQTTSVIVIPEQFMNGTLALSVLEENSDGELEPFGDLVKNLENPLQDSTHAFVKMYGENSSWAKALADQIGTFTGIVQQSGYAELYLYAFDLDRLFEAD